MQDIKSLTLSELVQQIKADGTASFRAGQIFAWLHKEGVRDFDEMTNLSKDLRGRLKEKCYINALTIEKKQVSAQDGTVKYLFGLRDGNCVESVLMQYKHGASLCISTQVGCKMGCKFCASTLGGLVRNLTASEMLDEIYTACADSKQRIASVVLMGIGEPLDNLENVLRFLELLSAPEGYNLSLRHVTLSTCGLVDKMDALAEKRLGLTLSVSLHAPTDAIRNQTMPVNSRYNIQTLVAACKRYFEKTGRRVSFEYALIDGVNDSIADAANLVQLLKGLPCHVNLIPVNEVRERGYKRTNRAKVQSFQNYLCEHGLNATLRRELGTDISAACGQLRREQSNEGVDGQW